MKGVNNFFPLIILLVLLQQCCYTLNSGGKMKTTVCGWRENERGNGLEVPCNYLLKGPDKYLEKAECIIKILLEEKRLSNEKYPFFHQCLSLISPVGLYPGISPWAFMQGGLICGVIGHIFVGCQYLILFHSKKSEITGSQ